MKGWAVLMIVAGCGAPSPQPTAPQPPTAAGPWTFAPSSAPADSYNVPPGPLPHGPITDATAAAVRDEAIRAGLPVPIPDARLFQACADLAETLPEDAVPSDALIQFAVQRHGIIETEPHVVLVWGDLGAPQAVAETLRPRLAAMLRDDTALRFGIGAHQRGADGHGAVVLMIQPSGIGTSPLPRTVPAGGVVTLDATIDPPYRDPALYITYTDGRAEQLAIEPHGDRFTARIECGAQRGVQRLEITAHAADLRSLASFPVWCGAAPPRTLVVQPVHDERATTPEQAEQRLRQHLDRDRAAAGLPALVWDDRLARVARGHAADMRARGAVTPSSPSTGSARDRLRAAKIAMRLDGQTVGRTVGAEQAHDGMMSRPAERVIMMSRKASHAGVGAVRGDDGEIYVAELFAHPPVPTDPARAVERVETKVAAAGLTREAELDRLAQELAEARAAGKSEAEVRAAFQAKAHRLDRRYARVTTVAQPMVELDELDDAGLLAGVAGTVGIGVAPGPHPELGDHAIWVVVVAATRRAP